MKRAKANNYLHIAYMLLNLSFFSFIAGFYNLANFIITAQIIFYIVWYFEDGKIKEVKK